IAAWLAIGLISNGADDPMQPTEHPFAGKYLQVYTSGEYGGGNLTDADVRTLGGRSFLVGKSVAPNSHWKSYEGKTLWIAWDQVSHITVCDSLEDLKNLQN